MRIGVDIDGTVYHWTRAVNEAVSEQFGITGLTEHTSWDYLHDQLAPEAWRWVWSDVAAEAVFGREDLLYYGSAEIVNALCADHEVHFVTHRNPTVVAGITGRWLRTHFHGYKGVHVLDSSVSKTTLGAWDVFIDDKPETIAEFAQTDALVLVPARPWNECVAWDRFANWTEVPGRIGA